MSTRRFALFAALAFFIMFVAGNVIANSWLRSWRLDLTESRLYSLSQGTKQILDELSEPVQLTLYYSRDATTGLPDVQAYASRVRELLQTYAARSNGRVRFVEVDVEPFTQAEDEAAEAGIEPRQPQGGGDPVYFGLVGANAIDDQRAIPFFDPNREQFLEYELTRLIYELEHPNRTRVGLISSLPLDPNAAANPFGQAAPRSAFAGEMGRLLDVQTIAPDFTEIPDVDVLAIIHPGALSPVQLYAIDQFILRKGRAFIALDPASLAAAQQGGGFDPFNPVAPAPTSSMLEPLLSRWGVSMSRDVVLDAEGALDVTVQQPDGQVVQAPQPLFFAVPAEQNQLDRQDLMTAWLRRGINFGLAGALSASEREGLRVTHLARTSGTTMRMTAEQAMMRPSPDMIRAMWPPSAGRVETVALRLSGNLDSAFNGPPEGAPPPAEGQTALTRSATTAEIVIVSDADFLSDDFYVDPQSGASAADNASFALNAIDILGGSEALVSLRSRADSVRRMTLVEDMERRAQEQIADQRDHLQTELAQTETQLAELQARGRGSGFFTGDLGAELTPEENAAIERFRARAMEVRSELRGVERNLRGDISNLETLIVFLNVWLAPLLVAGAGLFFFWRRQQRGRQGARR
jgi:ABC-type uncharacterized transport system involved in gliding motility auxiliary subunit